MAHQFDTSVDVAFQYITRAFEYRYHPALSPVIWHLVCPSEYSNMIWTASIGSSSGPQAFPFPIFAIWFFTSSNEKHSTGPSVVGNSSSCSLGFSALKGLSNFCFHLYLIFPDSVKTVPCSSLTYAMRDMSILLLSLLLASLYIIFAPSLVSSLVYSSSYASSCAIATAIFACNFVGFLVSTVLFFTLIFLVCFERLFFGFGSTSGVVVPP